MRAGQLGQIITPAASNRLEDGVPWCADNAAYTGRYPGDQRYLAWLAARVAHAPRCAFATAPDVVGDAAATLARAAPMLPRIRALGYPVALVAQDGLEQLPIDLDAFDVLFLGGSTGWMLGPRAAVLAARARAHGLSVHMGRVNSLRRLRHAAAIGCDSVDGTYLAHGPDRNLPTLLGWLRTIAHEAARPVDDLPDPLVIRGDQVMTDINDGPGDIRPGAPAPPDVTRTTTPTGPTPAHTPAAHDGPCAHPGIIMRPGPTGPRAALVDGPDVWELVAALRALREEDPTRHGEALRGDLCSVTGLRAEQVAAALDYYRAHPTEVDRRIADNDDAAVRAHQPPTAGGPPPRDHAT